MITGGNSSLSNGLKPVFSAFAEVITAGRKDCDITLDLNDPAAAFHLLGNIDTVIHTAGHFGGKTDKDISDAEYINVLGTLKICQAAVSSNVKHVVYISSIFSSLTPASHNYSIYALSKKHSEELAAFYCSGHSLPLAILRPSQLYGSAESFRKHQPFFYLMVDKAEKGEDIELYGSHDPVRNYIHIDDMARIVAEVVKQKTEGVFGCVNQVNTTYSRIAEASYAAFNTRGKVSFFMKNPTSPITSLTMTMCCMKRLGFLRGDFCEEGIKKIAKTTEDQVNEKIF